MASVWVHSGYGWRTRHLRRKQQFHKGIDIPAWTGAPVQATADGYVEFAGYGGGYSWMIAFLINLAIRPFLCSFVKKLRVPGFARVFKGQIIGKIGTSGLSTGPLYSL